jgi:hypothetical protein
LAQHATGADGLKQSLARHLAGRYTELANVEQELGRQDVAEEWFKAARHYEAASGAAGEQRASAPQGATQPEVEAPSP